MEMNKFKGIFPALLTPFDKNDKVNDKELEKLVKYNANKGVSGFYVTGSTGEALLMNTDERKYVMDIVKASAPDKTLIAHIGSVNQREAESLAEYAGKIGYDAVSSVAPYYYKFSFDEIKNYYSDLADASGLPMLVYYIPAFSGVNMGVEQLSEFLADDRFLGIKYTSNDFFMMERCKTSFCNKIVYNGYDEMLLSGLAMGADGGIGSTYNFMAEKFIEIQRLFGENKPCEARKVQQEANRIISVLCKVGVMQAEKEIMNQLGFDFGVCRKPFGELNDEQKKLIAEEVVAKL